MAAQYDDSRFTDRSRKVMKLANDEARRLRHSPLDLAHLFLGLIKEGSGVAANVLRNLDVDLRAARMGIEELLPPGTEDIPGVLPISEELRAALERSVKEGEALNHRYVGTEHLLLALCQFPGPHERVLANARVSLKQVRSEVLELLGHPIGGDTATGSTAETDDAPPIQLLLDPGSATAEEISGLLYEMSKLYRLVGGRGIQFTITDSREPVFAEGVQ